MMILSDCFPGKSPSFNYLIRPSCWRKLSKIAKSELQLNQNSSYKKTNLIKLTTTMLKLNHIFLLMLSFLIFSCGYESNESTIIQADISTSTPLIMTEWFSEITYIPLSAGVGNYISDISKIRISLDYIVILEDQNLNRKLYVFARNGILKGTIINPEQGPGKFLGVFDFWINNDGKTIELLDHTQGKIIIYGIDGNYIKDIPLQSQYQEFVKLAEDEYVLYASNTITDKNGHNVNVVNLKNGIKESYLPIPTYLESSSLERFSFSFEDKNSRFLFSLPFANMIYSFNKKPRSFIPEYKIDFGKDWIDRELEEKLKRLLGSYEGVLLMNECGKIHNLRIISYIGKSIFFSCFLKQKLYFCIYNPSTKEVKIAHSVYGNTSPNDYDLGPSLFYLASVYNQDLVFFIWPHELKDHLASLSSAKIEMASASVKSNYEKLKALSGKTKMEDNPIIIFAHVKDQ
ncbi:MAG: 6-bladed beta-propeller [Saprospiraceae bacterium]